MVQERGETGIDAKQQLEGSSAELFEGCEQLFICLISGTWAQAAISGFVVGGSGWFL
jgi:hypothetical protein